jgi:glycosyltransferase involved in cell wall biosynthesis
MKRKPKLLCILHRSPPAHGAAKVGDFIGESKKLQEAYECKFITIKSSDTIGDIGKVNFKKIYLVAELYLKVLFTLIVFRPDKIYYTASVSGVAFYRDLLVSTLWKVYEKITTVDVFYHYHTKGIDRFVSLSSRSLKFTKFFLKNVNVILLSPLLEKDFEKVKTYKRVLFLPNGVENNYTDEEFEKYIEKKDFKDIHILYLSNMIKSKGYFEVLKLAKLYSDKDYMFHFAGAWQDDQDEKEFFEFIEKNNLDKKVIFHGFVNGNQKKELFEKASTLIFPTRYEKESFGLVAVEAFSYGVPVISTDEGSLKSIINEKSGIVISDLTDLSNAFEKMLDNFVNKETAVYCRQRYLEKFSLEKFENNLVKVFR